MTVKQSIIITLIEKKKSTHRRSRESTDIHNANLDFQKLLLAKIEMLEKQMAQSQGGGLDAERLEAILDRRDDFSDGEEKAANYGIPVGRFRKFLYYMFGDGMNEFKVTSKAVLIGMTVGSVVQAWLVDQLLWYSVAFPYAIATFLGFFAVCIDYRIDRRNQVKAISEGYKGEGSRLDLVKLNHDKKVKAALEKIKAEIKRDPQLTEEEIRGLISEGTGCGVNNLRTTKLAFSLGCALGALIQPWIWENRPEEWVRFTVLYTAIAGIIIGLLNDVRLYRFHEREIYKEAFEELGQRRPTDLEHGDVSRRASSDPRSDLVAEAIAV